MKILIKLILILVSIFILVSLFSSVYYDYETIAGYLQQTSDNLLIKLDVFNILTSKTLLLVQLSAFSFSILLLYFAIYKTDKIHYYICRIFDCFRIAFRSIWLDIKTKEALLTLIVPFVASIYFGMTLPVSYDEVVTYVDLTSKPFYFCMVYYPYPNNHILHTLLTNITEHLPFFDILFRIRIPSIIVSIFSWIIAYSFVKKYYSEKAAIFIIALSAVLFRSLYYSYMSRGYALIILFFIIALYAAFNIVHKENHKKDWMFFILSGVLGCYAIPSFLYPWLTLNLFIFIYNYKHIVQQIIYNLITAFFVLVLYTPIFLTSGVKAIAGNKFVISEDKTRLDVLLESPSFFYNMLENFFGFSSFIVLLFLIVCLIIAIKKQNKQTLILWAVFGITPFLILFLHKVIPFHRTFIYYVFVIVFLMGISIQDYINKIQKTYLISFTLIIQILACINFKLNIAKDEGFNTYANEVSDHILEPDKSYLVNYPHIVFDAINKNYNSTKIRVNEGDVPWCNTDTIADYDYIAIYKVFDKTESRKIYYSNQDLNVYKKGY